MVNWRIELKKLLLLGLLLLIPTYVSAQTNYCDTTPPTSGVGSVGVSEVVSVCAPPNDTNNNPVTITGWTMYDNGVASPITMTKGATSSVSGLTLYTGTYTPTTAGNHSLQSTSTGNGKESAKSTAFLLQVSLPPSAPQAPVKLSTQ